MRYEHNEYPIIDGVEYKVECESNEDGEIEDWNVYKKGKKYINGREVDGYVRIPYDEMKEKKLIEKVNEFIDTLSIEHILEEQSEIEEEEEYLSKEDIADIKADMKYHEMKDEGLI